MEKTKAERKGIIKAKIEINGIEMGKAIEKVCRTQCSFFVKLNQINTLCLH